MASNTPTRPPGRPRAGVNTEVFAATLHTVNELGYARATVERIAAAAGIAKSTIYRRWPTKGDLITDCLVDAFGPVPLNGKTQSDKIAESIHWIATKIAQPGIGDAFAGVFSDAVSDPALREVLSTRLQAPYLETLKKALNEPEQRVLFLVDTVVGTLLHRMGMTGKPMDPTDVTELTKMVLTHFTTTQS